MNGMIWIFFMESTLQKPPNLPNSSRLLGGWKGVKRARPFAEDSLHLSKNQSSEF